MRVARVILSFALNFGSSPRLNSQQSAAMPQRDPQATAMLPKLCTQIALVAVR